MYFRIYLPDIFQNPTFEIGTKFYEYPVTGLELNRFFLAGACRAPSLKNLGARRKISAPVNFEPCG